MDPQATFAKFCRAVLDGDYDDATEAEQDYNEWVRKGGFPATDPDGCDVLKLDLEQDRYLCSDDGIERWRKV